MTYRLPNFIYGGPPKAGSSWIFNLLDAHPEVFVPEGKYVQFFTDFYDRGLDWYAEQYADAKSQHTAICDLTTDYLFVPEAAERLAKTVPDAKIFFSLRNPVDRDWSAYQHLLRTGQASGPLDREIEEAHRLLSTCSGYSAAITRAWDLFGKENTLVLYFDDIKTDPQGTADSLHAFLRVSHRTIAAAEGKAKNPARAARNPKLNGLLKKAAITMRAAGLSRGLGALKSSPMVDRLLFSKQAAPKLRNNPDAQKFLLNHHTAEIKTLEDMLQKDLSCWRTQQQ